MFKDHSVSVFQVNTFFYFKVIVLLLDLASNKINADWGLPPLNRLKCNRLTEAEKCQVKFSFDKVFQDMDTKRQIRKEQVIQEVNEEIEEAKNKYLASINVDFEECGVLHRLPKKMRHRHCRNIRRSCNFCKLVKKLKVI